MLCAGGRRKEAEIRKAIWGELKKKKNENPPKDGRFATRQ